MDRAPEPIDKFVDAWNRRDEDAMLLLVDPEFEYVNASDALEPGTRHGPEGLATVVRKQWEGLGDASQQIDSTHRVGDEIVTKGRVGRTMPGSSSRVENRVALRWTLREGRVLRLEVLGAGSQFKAALEAAGVAE